MERIGIFCADESELAPFLRRLEREEVRQAVMLPFTLGRLEGCPVALVAGGVGKVNAAIAVQQLISLCGAKAVIDAGAAGGLRDSLAPFDTVVAEQVAYHDVAEEILTESHPHLPTIWMRPDPRLLEAARRGLASQPFPGRKVVFGRCITGEAFIAGPERLALQRALDPDCVDMETAAVAHVCLVNQVPFLSVRTISDGADGEGAGDFEENCSPAAEVCCQAVCCVLDQLNRESEK